jgi:hypothetical protein
MAEDEISKHKPGLGSSALPKTSSLLAVRDMGSRGWRARSGSHNVCNRLGGAVQSEALNACIFTANRKRVLGERLRVLPTIDGQ